jgi:subtilisin-like proprotein convertase family protein
MTLLVTFSYGQNNKSISYTIQEVSADQVNSIGTVQIQTTSAKYFVVDVKSIETQMAGVMHREDANSGFSAIIELPHPDGSMHSYKASENSTMSPELAEKFPEIHSYDAKGVNEPSFVKWDITPHGMHAMIMRPGQSTIYIDPAINGNNAYYVVYSREHYIYPESMDCQTQAVIKEVKDKAQSQGATIKMFGSCELHAYRLALAATAEYTQFHGGTIALAQAAQVTSMNRVNGVFEKDMAITMNIIGNNNLLIYTNATSDPFTNGNPGNMINQNQTNTDAVIGSANYDIGHVFGTNSGGLAGLGVVCSGGNKARGVTGSAAPIGDPFDIDYVAHEMGHQFGANHTQNNNCNRNNATAMEPGSASTIMGYAVICAPTVQNHSDDHFHGISLQEIGNEINSHTCEALTPLANNAPSILSTNGNVTVPANTPFALTAIATDPDGDPLTYNWEQMDNEVSTQPPSPTSTGGPNFRSISSLTSPTRYFPNLVDLAAGGPFTWEVIPSVTRTMDFRCTLRDNAAGPGGCNDHVDVTVTTDASSGPFIVLYPSATGIVWTSLTNETVTWDVANTDIAPVSCSNVDILLSTDGGATYPVTLASNVPNDGSQLVSVPNTPTTTARIMVICSSGTFFDISDNNFEIVALTDDFTLSASPQVDTVCQPNDVTFTLNIGVVGTFTDNVTLSVSGVPAGATSNFSVNPVSPAGASTLTISNTASATPGTYPLVVTATSTSGTKTETLSLTILPSSIIPVSLTTPLDASTGVLIPTNFTWTAISGATYDIQIASDAGFTTIVDQAVGLTTESFNSTALTAGTAYYWRVNAITQCGSSGYSSAFSFTTTSCITYASTNVPIQIPAPGTGTYTSTLNVAAAGTINDLNVIDLVGTHNATGNLIFTLQSPLGTVVTLMSQECGNQNDFDIDFDDEAASATIPCPPTNGNAYQPAGLLSAFDGEDPNGTWTLSIQDVSNPNGGQLNGWSLEICTDPISGCTEPDVPVLSSSPSNTCDGGSATITIIGNLNDATNWEIYEGSCGGTLVGSTAGGSFDVTPPALGETYFIRGEGGCTTSGICASITITSGVSTTGTDVQTACDTYTWIDGNTYTASNNSATHVLTNAAGCDSIVTLDLTINYSSTGTDVQTACDTYTWIDGNTYTASNNSATHVLTNAAGCDSLVTLDLTINYSTTGTDVQTACNSYTWIDGNTYTASNNSATHVLTNAAGCDSIVTLNLTINYSSTGTDVQTACNSYTWIDGNTYTASNNSATHVLTNAAGCDSIVTLDLTINYSTTGTDVQTACNSYTWIDGNTYTASNNSATHILTNAAGCDSIVTLDLIISDSITTNTSVSICEGQVYQFGTQSITTPGNYVEVFSSVSGCDSTVNLTLTVDAIDVTTSVIDETITANASNVSYQWIDCDNGNTFVPGATSNTFAPTITGNYAVILTTANCTDTSACTLVNVADLNNAFMNSVQVYPNPVNDQLMIQWEGEVKKIEITDTKGRLIQSFEDLIDSVEINTSSYSSGVYFVYIKAPNGQVVKEIVKL